MRRLRVPGLILGAALALGIVAQIVAGLTGRSWTDAYEFGRVSVPGMAVLHLPAGSLDVSLRSFSSAGGIPPGLHLTVTPLEGPATVTLTRDVGDEFGPSGKTSVLSYRRVWKADIPEAAAYRVVTAGPGEDASALEFGHAPGAVGVRIWEFAGLAALAALVVWLIARVRERA
jgi:hypothetical protein